MRKFEKGGGLKIAKKRDLIFEQPLILTLVLEWIINLVTFDAYAVLCSSALCLFSVCGKLTGHYPAARWLRVACSFVKRAVEGDKWNDYI